MVYLLLSVVSIVTFLQLLRGGQQVRGSILVITAANYIVAAGIAVALALLITPDRLASTSPLVVALAIVNGVTYFVHLLIMLAGYRIAGVGVTTALATSGVVLPIVLAWLIWDDPMHAPQWAALALLPLAIALMRPPGDEHAPQTWREDLVLLFAFVFGGTTGLVHNWATEAVRPTIDAADGALAPMLGYQALLFVAAAGSSVGWVLYKRLPWRRPDVTLGTAVGVFNIGATLFLLLALGAVAATVVFPIHSSLILSLNVIVARIAWRERLRPRQFVGLATALAIVVLAQIR